MGDPYEILGVKKDDDLDKIKAAYWLLAKRMHPDKNGGVESEEFKRVSWAWSVISDPAKRKQYDEHGTTDFKDNAATARNLLVNFLFEVLSSGVDPDREDVLKRVQKKVDQAARHQSREIETLETEMKNIKNVVVRFNECFLKDSLNAQLDKKREIRKAQKNQMEIFKIATNLLEECKYNFDEMKRIAEGTLSDLLGESLKHLGDLGFEERVNENMSKHGHGWF